MTPPHPLSGVYAAAVTPLNADLSPDLENLPHLLDFLARRGCHGVLLLGTTGEGPSFTSDERLQILRAALQVRQAHPGFRLLAGTGTPCLEETVSLTHAAFDLGMDGVVVLPPYYYRKVTDEGLYAWFSAILHRSVPPDGGLLAYHIPSNTGISLSLDLLAHLKDVFQERFAGLKDSSGDAGFARQLGARFGHDLLVLTGNDCLFNLALQHQASGCITAMANLLSPQLRLLWDAFQPGAPTAEIQDHLSDARQIMDRYTPFPPIIKALLSYQHQFPLWTVRPPLLPVGKDLCLQVLAEFTAAAR